MTIYNLANVPNQEFSIVANEHDVLIRFRTFREVMYADVTIDRELRIGAAKVVPNTSFLTKECERILGGKLLFKCLNDDYPNYKQMNTADCTFVYIPKGEA